MPQPSPHRRADGQAHNHRRTFWPSESHLRGERLYNSKPGLIKSAFNIRVVSGRVASPGEVLVVVLVGLVVAF